MSPKDKTKQVPRLDPTRTTTLRRQFMAEMNKRFRKIRGAILEAIVEKDALGFSDDVALFLNEDHVNNTLTANVNRQAWRFLTDDQKLLAFQKWFQQLIDENVLTTDAKGQPWLAKFVESAHRKGGLRSWMDANRFRLLDKEDWYEGSKEQFIRSAFNRPERVSKVKMLSLRTFEDLKGVTSTMATRMSRTLAQGIAEGRGPRDIAREMNNEISKRARQRALTIARTEVIHAHAEGQLDGFEDLGVEEVGVYAEWLVTPDEKLCDACAELEGVVMPIEEARGLLPRHPNCFTSPRVPVLTKDGWVSVGDIEVGDMVLTHKGRFRPVTRVFRQLGWHQELAFFRVDGQEDGFEMTVSHEVRVYDGWTHAGDLKIGDGVMWLDSDAGEPYLFSPRPVVEHGRRSTPAILLHNLEVEEDESYVAKGMVVHNCRCAFKPALDTEKEEGQVWDVETRQKAIKQSIGAELPPGIDEEEALEKTTWRGKELVKQ